MYVIFLNSKGFKDFKYDIDKEMADIFQVAAFLVIFALITALMTMTKNQQTNRFGIRNICSHMIQP